MTKVKDGVEKKRTILDAKSSGVTECSRKMYRALYPRSTDVINDVLELASQFGASNTELFVLDFVDAFWQVPLRHCERKFFTGNL